MKEIGGYIVSFLDFLYRFLEMAKDLWDRVQA